MSRNIIVWQVICALFSMAIATAAFGQGSPATAPRSDGMSVAPSYEPVFRIATQRRGEDPPTDYSMSILDGDEDIAVPCVNHFRCRHLDYCPAGSALLTQQGFYTGCTSTCGGECVRCSGAPTPVSVCEPGAPTDCCDIRVAMGSRQLCGRKGFAPCFVFAASPNPVGVPDLRGCGCNAALSYGGEVCNSTKCTS